MHSCYSFRMHMLLRWALLCLLSVLSACGGGGGGTSTTQTFVSLPPSAANASDANVALVSVEAGPRNNVNIPYVSVTLCVPGSTTNCQTIDHIVVDTGSYGLRVFATSLATLTLPAHTIGGSATISECAQFALQITAWGQVKVADLTIGNKRASSVPIQVMDVGSSPCSGALMSPPTVTGTGLIPLSANGILGIGKYINDGQTYYNCANPTPTTCQIYPAASQQVKNPIAAFTSDNNGAILQLPSVPSTGATRAPGYLIFGVETQSNNRIGTANIVPLNNSGYFTTTYQGRPYTNSIFDSGSNGLYFDDTAIPTGCYVSAPDFYCPPADLSLTASIRLATSSALVNFHVFNTSTLFTNVSNYVFNNLGGTITPNFTSSSSIDPMFDWGLPFFFGRSVYTVLEGKTIGNMTGPFHAFTN